jgi:hypothetical protein
MLFVASNTYVVVGWGVVRKVFRLDGLVHIGPMPVSTDCCYY